MTITPRPDSKSAHLVVTYDEDDNASPEFGVKAYCWNRSKPITADEYILGSDVSDRIPIDVTPSTAPIFAPQSTVTRFDVHLSGFPSLAMDCCQYVLFKFTMRSTSRWASAFWGWSASGQSCQPLEHSRSTKSSDRKNSAKPVALVTNAVDASFSIEIDDRNAKHVGSDLRQSPEKRKPGSAPPAL